MTGRVILPLFPLRLVVFPGEQIKLHIFEDRYKQLLKDCGKEKPFGIPCLFDEMIAQVGCAVLLDRVLEEYKDGSSDIIVRGIRRFRMESENAGRPYPSATVEFFDDESSEEVDPLLRQRVITLFTKYSELTSGSPQMRDFTDLPFVSFAVASLTGLSLPERQMILEIGSEKERLESLDIFLTESVTKLAAKDAIEDRVKTNGHFKH